MDDGRNLRRELDRIGIRRGRCVPAALKRRAGAWLAEQRRNGRSVAELAGELGLAVGTVLRWSAGGGRALVPVRVVPEETRQAVAVVSPSGFRIEGLSLLEAARVLRELG